MKQKRSPNALDFDLEPMDLDFKDVVLDLNLGNLDFGPILGFCPYSCANNCPLKGRKRRKKKR